MRKELYVVFLALIGWQGVFMSKAGAQVTAEFSATVTSGCAPQLVEFNDLSTGTIDTWSWTLGDPDGDCGSGPPSTLPDPGRIFTEPGSYCICLTVTDAVGNSDTECKDDFIEIFGPPTADIVANPGAGCPPVTVTFDDVSTAGSAPIVNWQWDLNNSDCQGLTGPTVSCEYDIPGTYDISIIVTDQNGCQDFLTVPDMVTVIDIPDVSFAANPQSSCSVPAAVQFINTIANPANLIFDWDFGEPGATSTDPNPSYTYTDFGDYTITLNITDTITGCTNSLTQDNFINIGNPVFFAYSPENGCTDLTVDFTDLTTNSPSVWQWDFGDGIGTSTDQNPSYTYTAPGCYTVTLTATNAECTGTRVAEQCIEVNQSPTVSYNLINESFCDIPHTVDFEGFSDIATSWFWEFGDGSTSDQQNPSHTYTTFGTFPVSLTVFTADSCSATVADSVVTITDFNVNVNPSVDEGCAPLEVTFNTNNNSNSPVNMYEWDFGDPTLPPDMTSNPTVTYPDTGVFEVVLTAQNDEGCNDTTTVTIVAGEQLTPVFGADSTLVCASQTITFTDSTEGMADEWFWEFGDGGTSTEQNPMYTYQDTGTFTVCLTVLNRGCPNTTCIDDYITVLPPIALFARLVDCDNPFVATFEDQSIGATDWLWQFDENDPTATSILQNPTYTYPDTGTYLVTLEVSNDTTGCTDMLTQLIEIRDPMASFTVMPDSGCAPLTLMINNTSVDAVAYNWVAPGADIVNPAAENPTIVYNNGGTFSNIELTVTDVNGCTDVATFTNDIFVSEVIPAFDISVSEGCRPLTVQFTDQSTTFGGVITDRFWDLGNGLTSMDQNPTITINNVGVRDVSLTVSNSLGCTQTLTFLDTIRVTFPNVDFEVDTLACPDQILTFNNNTAAAAPAIYEWDFGDNTTSMDQNPTHSYTDEGVYTVNLIVTDRNGCVDSLQQDITVAVPIANFVADTLSSSCPPQVVNFTDLSVNAFEWEWDFGDGGANVFGQNVQRIYTEPGVYTVCLYVNSSTQCADTLCFVDYIQIDGPQGSFDSTSTREGCAPFEVTFYGSGSNVVSYTWDDGAGGIQANASTEPIDSITVVYNTPGIYFPVLSVADGPGCERSFPFPDPIIVHGVTSDIFASDTVLCGTTQVTFGANIDPGIDTLQSIEWLFPGGDPAASTAPNPVVNYDLLGSYDVTLIADIGFCVDTLTVPDFITVTEAPIPGFTWTPNQACDPGTIAFSDQTQLTNDVVDQWIWDFGTGDSAFV
ncbi:MAG: PKD domain-containing protein, partial [Bacteroidota bacterium]